MASVGELVKIHWLRQGIKLRPGVSAAQLSAFEAKYDVRLPEDMRECFSAANGFEDGECDDEYITFFPLEEIERLNASAWGLAVPASPYFVFADWSISAHVYAIHLSKEAASNPVVVTYNKLVKVADSFGEFMQGYVAGDYAVLYPPEQV
jgi:hypothetical protein